MTVSILRAGYPPHREPHRCDLPHPGLVLTVGGEVHLSDGAVVRCTCGRRYTLRHTVILGQDGDEYAAEGVWERRWWPWPRVPVGG